MRRSLSAHAFTLVELLAVIAIMAIVLSFVVPAFSSTMRSMQLTQAAESVSDQLHIARQTALTKNHPIEVRFYSYSDPRAAGSSKACRAIQSFQINDDGSYTAVNKAILLPDAIIIDSNPTLSTLLNPVTSGSMGAPATASGSTLNVSVPRVGNNYDSIYFHFLPDGSTNLPADGTQWCVSLHYETLGNNLTALPQNFATVQIDPYNGQTRTFRP